MMIRRRLIAISLFAPFAAMVAGGCSGHEATSAQAEDQTTVRVVPITVATVDVRPVERTVDLVGTLRGWEEVTVGTKRAGRVIEVLHDIGDRVEPGTPLVKLETVDAELNVQQADRQLRAELAKIGLSEMPTTGFNVESVPSVMQARVTLEQARRELNRLRGLSMRNAASLQEVQNAEDTERSASASYDNAVVAARSTLANAQAAQVALQVAKQALEDTIIRAPVPSVAPSRSSGDLTYAVTRREVSEGQMLAAGADVMSLAIDDPLKLEGTVPERFIGEVALDQVVDIRVAAYAETFEGRITRINPAVDPVSRTFGIEAIVPNTDGRLRPGSFAKASIVTRHDDRALTLPLEAIVSFAGVTKVFVIDGDKAREVQVTTRIEDPEGQWIEVVGPLEPGWKVATSGMSQLADQTPVIIRDEFTRPHAGASPGAASTETPASERPTPPVAQEGIETESTKPEPAQP